MSKLSDLKSKGTKIVLSNELQLEIKPMTLDEEVELAEFQKNEETFKAIKMLVEHAIKRAIPDVTDDEINELNKEDLKIISEAVLKINGLGDTPEKKD